VPPLILTGNYFFSFFLMRTWIVEDNGTIDYLSKGVSIFRTHPSEKSKLVFQIGSANADLALQAALTVYVCLQDVFFSTNLCKQGGGGGGGPASLFVGGRTIFMHDN
jgi:hypothetical protein